MEKLKSVRQRALQSKDAVELLSDKWRIVILHLLTPGPLRASELQRAIHLVSPKMLTPTLRGLERDGLIERRICSVVPARVEYKLSTMGESVIPLLRELCHWAKAHVAERDFARKRFDVDHRNLSHPKSRALVAACDGR
jgi:DNA-binding HxlR family transcriptional regulator